MCPSRSSYAWKADDTDHSTPSYMAHKSALVKETCTWSRLGVLLGYNGSLHGQIKLVHIPTYLIACLTSSPRGRPASAYTRLWIYWSFHIPLVPRCIIIIHVCIYGCTRASNYSSATNASPAVKIDLPLFCGATHDPRGRLGAEDEFTARNSTSTIRNRPGTVFTHQALRYFNSST